MAFPADRGSDSLHLPRHRSLQRFSLHGIDASTGRINLDGQIPVEVSDMNEVTLAGLAGDDSFSWWLGPTACRSMA